jgi:hypothetical protein
MAMSSMQYPFLWTDQPKQFRIISTFCKNKHTLTLLCKTAREETVLGYRAVTKTATQERPKSSFPGISIMINGP